MSAPSNPIELLNGVDPDMLGVVLLMVVILSFASLIAITVTLIEAIKSVLLARQSRKLIRELLEQGFSPTEVAQLVSDQSRWSKVKNWMRFGREAEIPVATGRYAVPPVKQPRP